MRSPRSHDLAILLATCTGALLACDSPSDSGGRDRLDPVAIDAAFSDVTIVAQVRALGRDGNPVPGVTVTWDAADGVSSVDPATSASDQDGVARTAWRIGAEQMEYRLRATADNGQATELSVTPRSGPAVYLEIWVRGNVLPFTDSIWLPRPGDSMSLQAYARDGTGHVTIDSLWDGLEWTSQDPQVAQMRGARVHAADLGSTHVYARMGELVDSLPVTVGEWPGAGADVALVAAGNAPEVFAMDTSAMTTTSAFRDTWFPTHFELSPDGDRLLYGGDKREGRYLYLFDLRTRTAHYLVAPAGDRAHPLNGAFSPDGESLAYTDRSTLHIAAANGSEPRTVASDVSTMSWSAGGHLVYVQGLQEVWILAPGAAEPERVSTTGIGGMALSHARLSHDGTRLLLVAAGELLVREVDGTLIALSPALPVNDAYWMPDGRIVYDVEFETSDGIHRTLHAIATDGSNEAELLAPGLDVFAYDVSDSGMILYNTRSGPVGAYSLAPDGTERLISDGFYTRVAWAR